jgi:UDP-3-O-[3-hydroxymyristoyl] glucosamine N-acyltransferase
MTENNFYYRLGPLPLVDIIDGCDCTLPEGQFCDIMISGAKPVSKSCPGDISYFEGRNAQKNLKGIRASACFVDEENAKFVGGEHCVALITKHPKASFAHVLSALYKPLGYDRDGVAAEEYESVYIAAGVVIGPGAHIGKGTTIGPNSVIGPNVTLGKNCRIGANVVIEFSTIGDNCVIQHGAVIGGCGFGVAMSTEGAIDIPHIGNVVLGDNVSVGCQTTIDRAMFGTTEIGSGCKFDNLVQIAHNVIIGSNSIFAAHVGISGSCTIGKNVIMGGKAGIADHINIGDNAALAAGSSTMKDVPQGEVWSGFPAQLLRQHMREVATLRKLAKPNKKSS